MLSRRTLITGFGAIAALGVSAVPGRVQAHHGWTWAEGELHTLTGAIKSAKLGNPHGLLKVTASDGEWTVEVGQPWRNARAGLKDSMFKKGAQMTFIGNRARDKKLKVLKAVRIVINGKNHDLYPERISS
jgi:hypothetical protein